jgi:dTDP-4-dehydrorhamnose 3,5-epimerase
MKVSKLEIPDVLLIEPHVFSDERGFFFESYHQEKFFQATGLSVNFVQDNHSQSSKNVLRGLHYQVPPMAQGKLVRVTQGEVFDVAVDIRKNSPTFGQFVSAILSAENKKQLWIPEGFAHGFLTLSDKAELLYKTTAFYSKDHDRSIRWDDKDLAIAWPSTGEIILSEKDAHAPLLQDME